MTKDNLSLEEKEFYMLQRLKTLLNKVKQLDLPYNWFFLGKIESEIEFHTEYINKIIALRNTNPMTLQKEGNEK